MTKDIYENGTINLHGSVREVAPLYVPTKRESPFITIGKPARKLTPAEVKKAGRTPDGWPIELPPLPAGLGEMSEAGKRILLAMKKAR
jgi:hypothetical protein